MNLILKTDSYKLSHWNQLRPGTTEVYEYCESRGGKFPVTQFFGLQPILQNYLSQPILRQHIDEAEHFANIHFGRKGVFNRSGWEHIVNNWGGYLPLTIRAVPEGTHVPVSNALFTIAANDSKLAWLPGYFESLLMKVWAPTTVATYTYHCMKVIEHWAAVTGSPTEFIRFKLHDFGYRGVSSEESAGILGASALVNIDGSDNIEGILFACKRYLWDWEKANTLPAYSVVATEHSTATPWGREAGEKEYILHTLRTYPKGIVSVVADSYDVYSFCKLLSEDPEIKKAILERDGVFVVRPDSGDPVEVVSRVLQILWDGFGGTYTSKSFRVLNDKIRIIQGDGVDLETMHDILRHIASVGFASENLVFGSGGALLQKHDRDTQKFAIKCSLAVIDGNEVNVQKDPITSSGKKSKQGRLKLHGSMETGFMTISSADTPAPQFNSYADAMRTVFLNGDLLHMDNFETIRKRGRV